MKKKVVFNCFDKFWYQCDHFKRFVYIFHLVLYEWVQLYLYTIKLYASFIGLMKRFPNEFVCITSVMGRQSSKFQRPKEWWLRCRDTWDWRLFAAKIPYPSSRSLSPASTPLRIPMDKSHLWSQQPENQVFFIYNSFWFKCKFFISHDISHRFVCK